MSSLTLVEGGIEALFGVRDENLRLIEKSFGVTIGARGSQVHVTGEAKAVARVERLIEGLDELLRSGYRLRNNDIRTSIRVVEEDPEVWLPDFFQPQGLLGVVQKSVVPRTLRQHTYLKSMIDYDLVISVGPAGTGKTYLAVAAAATYLLQKKVHRIVLARPAVEAGEKLGFLPGDLVDKVNPYLRPLYDALYDILGFEKVTKLLERGVIEVAPIAFMRGRTLNDSFIILDEAQNTTNEQMKMFLTRIGFGSKAVINGDITQVDLPRHIASGLGVAERVLSGVEGIKFFRFDERDVVRHSLVKKIVRAYDVWDQKQIALEDEGSSEEPRGARR